jgi:hypothetical protein
MQRSDSARDMPQPLPLKRKIFTSITAGHSLRTTRQRAINGRSLVKNLGMKMPFQG